MNVKIDLSGLKRLQKVMRELGGNHTWRFTSSYDLSNVDRGALAKEALAHLMGNEHSQKEFLSRRCFTFHSRLVGGNITAHKE